MNEIGRRFPRHLVDEPSDLAVGMYCVTPTETMAGVTKRVHVRCPECGITDELDTLKYTVLPHSGLVTPRWHCQGATCGYLERIRLESWGQS